MGRGPYEEGLRSRMRPFGAPFRSTTSRFSTTGLGLGASRTSLAISGVKASCRLTSAPQTNRSTSARGSSRGRSITGCPASAGCRVAGRPATTSASPSFRRSHASPFTCHATAAAGLDASRRGPCCWFGTACPYRGACRFTTAIRPEDALTTYGRTEGFHPSSVVGGFIGLNR